MKKVLLLVALLSPGMHETHSQWIRTYGPESVRALVIDGTTLYAGTFREGVWLSSNRGEVWEQYVLGQGIHSLAFTSSDFYFGVSGHIVYTPRGLTNWTLVPISGFGAIGFVQSLAANGNTVFAGTDSGGLFRTWHSGPSMWSHTRVGFRDTAVCSLLFDATTLYAGTRFGVYSSTDNGMSWTALNGGLTTLDTRALALKDSDLYAGTWGGGVFRSTDHGATWTTVNIGLTNKKVQSIAVSDHSLFAGTSEGNGGVFLSTDNGAHWTGVSHVSEADPWFRIPGWVHGLVVDGTYLYAGERTTGVWRRPLSEMVTYTEQYGGEVPRTFALLQNYPNPFNPTTTITYELPRSSEAKLSVYDMLGREMSVLVNERMDAGVHDVKFDGSGLASGVYFYRLRVGDFVATKRLLLLR